MSCIRSQAEPSEAIGSAHPDKSSLASTSAPSSAADEQRQLASCARRLMCATEDLARGLASGNRKPEEAPCWRDAVSRECCDEGGHTSRLRNSWVSEDGERAESSTWMEDDDLLDAVNGLLQATYELNCAVEEDSALSGSDGCCAWRSIDTESELREACRRLVRKEHQTPEEDQNCAESHHANEVWDDYNGYRVGIWAEASKAAAEELRMAVAAMGILPHPQPLISNSCQAKHAIAYRHSICHGCSLLGMSQQLISNATATIRQWEEANRWSSELLQVQAAG